MSAEKTRRERVSKHPGEQLLSYFENMVVAHDVAGAYPDLKTVVGISGYAYRALMVPARIAYVPSEYRDTVVGQVEYMHSIGIGPKEVRYVPVPSGTTLADAVWSDLKERGELQDDLSLSLFGQSEETQRIFVEHARAEAAALGVPLNEPKAVRDLKESVGVQSTLRLAGTSEGVANNKLFLRMVMERRCGQRGADPDSLNINFVSATAQQDLLQKIWEARVEKLIEDSVDYSVIVKATNLASGEALRFCKNVDQIRNFIKECRNDNPDIQFIIEEDLRVQKEAEMSAQFLVTPDGKPIFLHATENIVKRNHRGEPVVHWGNTIAGNPKDPINKALTRKTVKELKEIVEYYAQLGYRGYIGFDLLLLRSGKIKVLETNARITGATYPLLILEQLARQRKSRDFVVLATNMIAPDHRDLHTFTQLQERLGELIYTTERGEGIIPALVSPLPQKFGAVVVARDHERAGKILERALDRVGVWRGGL